MTDGFELNQGVPKGASRENPQPQGLAFGPVGVPENVPLVVPSNNYTKAEPNTGAIELARTLGNIDFGALSRQFTMNQAAKRKAKDEADAAAGQASTAQLLSQTGTDYETLVRAGKIPASASPAFQLGASIAAAQNVFSEMRTAVMQRGVDTPDAPNFLQDSEFMAPFYQRLGGVRNEAIVKYFVEPAQELAKDDVTRQKQAYDVQATQKFVGDALGTFENSIKAGDPIEPALNNTFNTLKLSHHLTPELAKRVIETAGPQIIQAATTQVKNPLTGEMVSKVDMALAGRLLHELGDAKIAVEGGRKLSSMHFDAYDSVSKYVYGQVTQASQAQTAQEQAHQADAAGAWTDWVIQESKTNPDGTMTLPTVQDSVKKAMELGYDPDHMLTLYKAWDSTGGNVSAAEDADDKFQAHITSILIKMSPRERQAYEAKLPGYFEQGAITAKDMLTIKTIINTIKTNEPKSPFRPEDSKAMKDSINQQLPQIFAAAGGNMDSHLLGATGRFGLAGSQYATLRGIVSDKIATLAQDWAVAHSPDYQAYVASLDTVNQQPGLPTSLIRKITSQFMQENGPTVGKMIMKALASDNPGAALDSLSLNTQPSQPPATQPSPAALAPKATRVYQAPTAAAPSQPAHTPAKAQPKAADSHASAQASTLANLQIIQHAANARTNLTDTNSAIFKWYALYVRTKHPHMSDAEIVRRVKSFPVTAIRDLQILFDKEHPAR